MNEIILKNSLIAKQNYKNNILNQLDIKENIFNINRRKFLKDSLLFKKKLISLNMFEQRKQDYLNEKISLKSLQAVSLDIKSEIKSIKNDLQKLNIENLQNKIKQINILSSEIKKIRISLDDWEKEHLIIAPIDGRISFSETLNNTRYVEFENSLFFIFPKIDNNFNINGKIVVGANDYSKIFKGQKVNIKLSSYQYTEYGILVGEITDILPLMIKDTYFYSVKIELGKHLKTDYDKDIPFYFGMRGTAEIILKEKSLFDKIFYKIKELL